MSLSDLSGKILAVDGFSWLHKSVFTCPEELSSGKATQKYISFFEKRIRILQSLGIQIYMVFDGNSLDAKKGTNDKRRDDRLKSRVKAEELQKAGQIMKARDQFARSVSISAEMCKTWINVCKRYNIPYVVAPFEADSQMVYLEKKGMVDGIISEDSDLIIFGCQNLYTKVDFDRNSCVLVERSQFYRLKEDVNARGIPKFDISEFSQLDLIKLVCLSGCDYTPGLFQIGLIKAYNLLKEFKFNVEIILQAIETEYIKKKASKPSLVNPIPEGYLDDYYRALACFQYMFVFDPIEEKMKNLNELPHDADTSLFKYLGSVAKTDGTISILNSMDEIDHDMQRLFSLGELKYKSLVKWFDREFAIVNKVDTENAPQVFEYEKETILNMFKDKEMKFILPSKKANLTRSHTEPADIMLQRKVEKRKLLSSVSMKQVSYSQSKYFGLNSVRVSSVDNHSEAAVKHELTKENEAEYIESLDSGVHEVSLNNHPNHMIVDFSEKKSEEVNPVEESDIDSFDDQDDLINATIQHKSELLEEIGSYAYKPEDQANYFLSPVKAMVTKEGKGEIILSPVKLSSKVEPEVMLENSSPVKKKHKGTREELMSRVNRLGGFLERTRPSDVHSQNLLKRSYSTRLSQGEIDFSKETTPSLKDTIREPETRDKIEERPVDSIKSEYKTQEPAEPKPIKVKTIRFPTGTITIFGKK